MSSTSIRLAAALTGMLLAPVLSVTVDGQGGGLFTAAGPITVGPAAAQPGPATTTRTATTVPLSDAITLRRRLVTIDFEALSRAEAAAGTGSAPSAALTLNLFDDVVLTGIVEQTAPTFSGGYSMSGRISGDSLGTVTLVVNGEVVVGTVRTVDGTYRIRSGGDGLYSISEVDLSKLPDEAEPLRRSPGDPPFVRGRPR